MPIEVESRPAEKAMTAATCRPLVPLRVVKIESMVSGGNAAREKDVGRKVLVGDVCVTFKDHQTCTDRILHCPSGFLLPLWYADYLLFGYAEDVGRVVIAKHENK